MMPFKKTTKVNLRGHTIIIGGGKLGINLMRDLPNSVVIENNPVKVYWLSREFGKERVIHGDGADLKFLNIANIGKADAIIVTIGVDNISFKIALTLAPLHLSKVMVRTEDVAYFKKYRSLGVDPFKISPAMSAKILERIIKPEAIHIHEFILPAKCEAVGKSVGDLELPNEIKVVSLLRGDHLVVPEPGLILKRGDVLTVMASEEDVLALRKALGARLDLNPLQTIYVPYRGKKTIKRALREAFIVAKHANAEVTLIYNKKSPRHRKDVVQIEQMFKLQNVKMHPKGISDIDGKGFQEYLKRIVENQEVGLGREILHFDCIMMDPYISNFYETFFGFTKMRKILADIDHPVLVAGNMNPYKSMLMLIDPSEHSDMQVSMAIDLAILFGSRVHVVIHGGEDTRHTEDLVKYVNRTGRLYGFEVTNQYVEGNPTLEFVECVKSDKFDLVVVNWRCRTIKRGIVRRIVEYGPRSVLIIP